LADLIKKELGEEVRLIKASNGLFEIAVNGENIHSRKKSGEFPVEADIVEKLKGFR
jgi:selT/selW/selH-like putative selenoprotein